MLTAMFEAQFISLLMSPDSYGNVMRTMQNADSHDYEMKTCAKCSKTS